MLPLLSQLLPGALHAEAADIARYEMKYLVDVALLPELREFVQIFCEPDEHCMGTPPEYEVTTLQFDTLFGNLCRMKEDKALNRFKLRARAYGPPRSSPLFLEIKRKIGDTVIKSRATIAPGWECVRDIINGGRVPAGLAGKSKPAFYEFIRLFRQIDAQPVMRVRYNRESWMSVNDGYARVTFDRALRYMPTRGWDVLPDDGRWRVMDSATATGRGYPGFILELKSTGQMPTWMDELIKRFNLVRCDFCKYATAMRLESLYRGFSYSDASENTTY